MLTLPIRKARRCTAVSTVAAALLLASCGISPDNPPGGGPGGSGAASVTIDMSGYPSTLDPGLQYDSSTYPVYRNVYDQLLRRDPTTLEPVPWLATTWTQESPTTWRFTLRDDVTFSDGTKLTAADAAYSLDRILDDQFASPQYSNFSAVASASALSPTELVIETKQPSPTLLTYLTTLSVVSQAYAEKVGKEGMNTHPMGSGAYTVDSATAGTEIRLVRRPGYWAGEPKIAQAIFRAVPTAATRVADLQSGRADLVLGLTADQAGEVQHGADLKVLNVATERVAYLALNVLGETPTSDLRVRQAIVAAIDYDSLIKNLGGGYADAVGAVATPLAFGYPKATPDYRFDPARAKSLLAEAGTPHPVLQFPASPAYDPQLLQAVQSDLQAVGFTVEITNTDQAAYLQKVQSPAHDWGSIRFGRWSCSCLDSDGVIYPIFRTGTVWSSWSNPQFDAAVDAARTTTDEARRKADYATAYAILAEQVPGIGLYQEHALYGAKKTLDWNPDAVESLYLDQMSVTADGADG